MSKPERTLATSREKMVTSPFLSSPTIAGQAYSLWTYAIPETSKNGDIALIKIVGCFATEEEAEKRATIELSKEHCKVVRIEPCGEWSKLRDPRVMHRGEYDQFDGKEVKHAIASMNMALAKKEDEDEKEMREHMRQIVEESKKTKEEDKESVDHFLILQTKIESLPGLITQYRAEIARLVKEIQRLTDLEPVQKKEYNDILKRHPDYIDKAQKLKESYKEA